MRRKGARTPAPRRAARSRRPEPGSPRRRTAGPARATARRHRATCCPARRTPRAAGHDGGCQRGQGVEGLPVGALTVRGAGEPALLVHGHQRVGLDGQGDEDDDEGDQRQEEEVERAAHEVGRAPDEPAPHEPGRGEPGRGPGRLAARPDEVAQGHPHGERGEEDLQDGHLGDERDPPQPALPGRRQVGAVGVPAPADPLLAERPERRGEHREGARVALVRRPVAAREDEPGEPAVVPGDAALAEEELVLEVRQHGHDDAAAVRGRPAGDADHPARRAIAGT